VAPADDLPPARDWSASGGPDLFTLRAWLAAERALEDGHPLDDTVAFLQDRVSVVFGPAVFSRFTEFAARHGVAAEGLGPLVEDEQRLQALLDFLLSAEDAPDLPGSDHEWRAEAPGSGHRRRRRSTRDRRRDAVLALLRPPRRRPAGRRRPHRG
jgi:hypothetical protein